MRLLLDTQLFLWALSNDPRLSRETRRLMNDEHNVPLFSALSIAEIAIKRALGKSDFLYDPHVIRRHLIEDGYVELPLTGDHAVMLGGLPPIHKDPFDRMLVSQAMAEGVMLLTANAALARYGAMVRLV